MNDRTQPEPNEIVEINDRAQRRAVSTLSFLVLVITALAHVSCGSNGTGIGCAGGGRVVIARGSALLTPTENNETSTAPPSPPAALVVFNNDVRNGFLVVPVQRSNSNDTLTLQLRAGDCTHPIPDGIHDCSLISQSEVLPMAKPPEWLGANISQDTYTLYIENRGPSVEELSYQIALDPICP